MQIGFLTAPFGGEPLENVVKFASGAGFDALEVAADPGSSHIDPANLSAADAKKIVKLVEGAGLRISSLAFYGNLTDPDPAAAEAAVAHVKKGIDACEKLGVEVMCAGAGLPHPGVSREEMLTKHTAKAYQKLAPYAAKKGVKIGLENWFATNIQNMPQWELLFGLVPDANFGLNFDPSHLYHQHIDYMGAVDQFAGRIFHSHAKDTEVNEWKKRWMGTLEGAWWRYVIPGFGGVDWGCYVSALRRNGLADVTLSIEHEDSTFGREEGFVKGLNYLRTFVS